MITQKAVHSCQLSGSSVSVVSSNHHNKLQKNTTILFSVRASLKEAFSRTPAFDFITCRQLLNFILRQIGGGLRNHRTLQLNYMFTIIGNIACIHGLPLNLLSYKIMVLLSIIVLVFVNYSHSKNAEIMPLQFSLNVVKTPQYVCNKHIYPIYI